MVNTDFAYRVVLKNGKIIDDHFNSLYQKCFKTWGQIFFYFLPFLLQKMESNNNKIISKRTRIMSTVKKFKEKIKNKKDVMLLKRSIKFNEDLANDKDQSYIEYLIDRLNYFENLLKSFLAKYNIDQTPEPIINNSMKLHFTFIKTPEWLTLKRCILNPNNKDNKYFQYSVIHEKLGRNFGRASRIKEYIDNFNWEILIFHHKNKIIIILK